MPKSQKRPIPPFLAQARAFYAEAFAHTRKNELAAAMGEWAELDESEQSFAVAHLAYLDLEAQALTHTLLADVRDLLDELAEAFTVAIEASFAEPAPPEEDEAGVDEPPSEDVLPPELSLPDVIDADPARGEP